MTKTSIKAVFQAFMLVFLFYTNNSLADFPSTTGYNYATRTGTTSPFTYTCDAGIAPLSGSFVSNNLPSNFPISCRNQPERSRHVINNNLILYYYGNLIQSCPANSTLNNGKCTCNTSHEFQRYNSTIQAYSCNNTSSENERDRLIALIAANLGLSISAATGLFTSFAACIASVVCAAGLAIAGFGALIFGLSFTYGDSTNAPPPPPNQPLEVRLADESVDPIDGTVLFNPGGSIKAPPNSTTQGTIKTYTNPDGGTVTIDEASGVVFTSKTNPDGSITSTLISNRKDGATILISESKPYGTAPDGTPVTQHTFTQNEQPITYSTPSNPPARSETTFSNNGNVSTSPPSGTTTPNGGTTGGGTGGNGTGTGTGTGSGNGSSTGDCATYGCAKESTQLQVLNSITQNVPASIQNTAQNTADTLKNSFELEDSAVYGKLTNALNSFIESTGIDDAFAPLNSFSPFADTYSNCSFTSNWFGNRTFSYCDEQPMIHTLLSYMFFVYFSMRIFTLVVNARGQSNTVF